MKNFTDRIRNFRGKPVYEILTKTKESKDSFFVCYRETLDNKRTCRNLDYIYMGGYKAYGKPEKKMIPFWNKKTPKIFALDMFSAKEEDIKPLLDMEPNFIYTFKKCGSISIADTFNLFKTWCMFPMLEILLNMGFYTLATNKNFLKLDNKRQREIVNYYLASEDKSAEEYRRFVTAEGIKGAMKHRCTYNQFKEYKRETRSHFIKEMDYKDYRKLADKNIPLYDYMWYMSHLKSEFPERLNDEYWTTFKDVDDFFSKEHKVNKQIDNRRKLEAAEARKEKKENYLKAINKYKKWDGTFNGLHIYIPKELADIENQAKALNQCLIDCDYIGQVIKKKCILAFIKKDNEPLATAELEIRNRKLKLGQFYGNELDRDNCLPPDGCKEALDMFMDKFIRKSA